MLIDYIGPGGKPLAFFDGADESGGEPAKTSSTTEKTETTTKKVLDPVPYDRFASVQTENTRLKAEAEAREKADREREAKEAEEKGEHKKLAEDRGKKIAELEPEAQRATKYAKLLNDQIDTEIKDWPASVKKLDPGADNVEARMRFLENGREIVAEVAGEPAPRTRGTGATPKSSAATGRRTKEQAVEAEKERRRATGTYKPL